MTRVLAFLAGVAFAVCVDYVARSVKAHAEQRAEEERPLPRRQRSSGYDARAHEARYP